VELKERFEALSKTEQQAILDKHRPVEMEDHWWDNVYEQFQYDLIEAGYGVNVNHGRPSIFFSGFCSQGDGACFEGYVADFTRAAKDFPVLLKAAYTDRSLRWYSRGNYCHAETLEFSEYFDVRNEFDRRDEPLRWHARESEIRDAENEWVKFVEATEKKVKDLCCDLYTKLEEENDHLTSDETVLENLIANDLLEGELNEQESA
jgi:hypothetical protein